MHIRHLELRNFRSWAELSLDLTPGVTVLTGPNGHGKTNVVEAIGYLATLGSHRTSSDAALVREHTPHAQLSATAVNGTRELTAHLALFPHAANRAHINRTALTSPRELTGIVRTSLFSPEDLALVRGEPEQRRTFIDSIMLARYPRLAGVKSDYDKALKQRNALLRSLSTSGPGSRRGSASHAASASPTQDPDIILATLDVWDAQLAHFGGQIMSARVQIVHDLSPHLAATYQRIAPESRPAHMHYTSTIDTPLADAGIALGTSTPGEAPALLSPELAESTLLAEFAALRSTEVDRGMTLRGPHRDDITLMLGTQPAKGFASHGESWSFALALRMAAFFMQRADKMEPIVILDDVFAELDERRRQHLVGIAEEAEQVLLTAAVATDIPDAMRAGATIHHVIASDTPEGRTSAITSTEFPDAGSAPTTPSPHDAADSAAAASAGAGANSSAKDATAEAPAEDATAKDAE